MTLLLRILAAVALLLMPFGMGAPAFAASQHGSSTQGHCNSDTTPTPDHQGKAMGQMHCAGTCTALPQQPTAAPSSTVLVAQPAPPLLSHRMPGEQPEIATPPPKLS